MHLIFASRPSKLARTQTQWVMRELQRLHPGLTREEKIITTQGDKILDKPLPEIGGKGLFTEELESELLSGTVHCAVHSLKDLPIESPAGLLIGCIPERVDARDVLVTALRYSSLESLPLGAQVGTSSLRRAAQLLALRPDLQLCSLRGNVDTRLRKAKDGQYDAIVLAGAGITRLGLAEHISQWLPLETLLPAPGQGALAVQCRADDTETIQLLSALDDLKARQAVTAERQFLLGLGGGCSAPVAAYAMVSDGPSPVIHLQGRVLSIDGKKTINVSGMGSDAVRLGIELAEQALAQGAGEILSMATEG